MHRSTAAVLLVASQAYAPNAAAQADWKPQRPIEIVVPVTAGGTLDRPARVLQQIWTESRMVDVPVNVSNKPGGGQSVGLTYVHQAKGDAHRFAVMSAPLVSNFITGTSKLHYSEFTILGQLFTEYMVVSVLPDSTLRSAADLVARLKPAPDALAVAIGTTVGNSTHISIAMPLKRAGVDVRRMKNVIFSSSAQSMTALLGGHVEVAASSLSTGAQHKRNGKLRILAVTAPRRLTGDLADVPTWREQGVDVVVSNWRFLTAPAGLTPAQIAWWDALFARTVKSAEWKKVIDEHHWINEFVASHAARKHLDKENAQTREILTELGVAKL